MTPLTITEAFGHAPQHLDGTDCAQGDDVTSGECQPYCAHGQELTESSRLLLCELEDEGFDDNVINLADTLRGSVERELMQLRSAAEQAFGIADALQGVADDHMAAAGRLQFRVDELTTRLEAM